jgi:rhodanese-related sulfurtransferase
MTASEGKPNAPKISSDAAATLLGDRRVFFLDVRDPKELEALGTFEGYVNIPLDQLERRLDEIPPDRPIVTA